MADSLYRYAQPATPQTNVLVRLRQSIEPETQTQISVLRRWAFIGALTGIVLSFSWFKVTPCSICTHSQINTDNTAEIDLGPGALIDLLTDRKPKFSAGLGAGESIKNRCTNWIPKHISR